MSDALEVRLHERCGRLPSAVGDAHRAWSDRRSIVLEIADGFGAVGLGEASPLPGYSPDSFESATAALRSWSTSDPRTAESERPLEAARRLTRGIDSAFPAARFAVETAVLDLLGQRAQQPLSELLRSESNSERRRELPLAELLPPSDETESIAAADHAVGSGIQTLKIKVGRPGAFSDELHLIEALRSRHGDAISIRLDANGSFPEDELMRRLSALAAFRPELIEEPVGGRELGALVRSPIGLAADESLQRPAALDELEPIVEANKLVALALKPMALGGIARCLLLAEWAAERDIACFVTHLWDGPLALAAAAHLALALPCTVLACGLGRHAGMAAWPTVEMPFLEPARLVAVDRPGLGIDSAGLVE